MIEPNDDIRSQGIRIMKNKANWDSFVLKGCNADPTDRDGVWKIGSTSSKFRIQKQEDEAYDYKGLIIDFDCTSLKFNNQIIAPLPAPPIDYAIQQTLAIAITHFNPNTYWNTEQIQSVTFYDSSMLDEYKTKPLIRNSLFLNNGNHYIVGAVGSGKTILLSKLIVIYKQRINPFILYLSNFGVDETIALNQNSKNTILTNITYEEAMYFLLQFDEIKYSVKEVYTYWKLRELNISYKSDYIQRKKERIIQNNPTKENLTRLASVSIEKQMEKPKDYARRIAQIFEQECFDKITKFNIPTMIMRFTVPAIIHNFAAEFIVNFDDIGSNADIQRFSSGLAKIIAHLVSDNRHSKNTVFFIAQRPSYLFKIARILSHVICLGVSLSKSDLKQAYEENSIQNLDFDEFSGTGVVGTSTEYSRGDHQHPLQVSTVLPSKDTSVGTVGQASSYARSDHQHLIQTVDTIPVSDSADGSYVNGVGNNGTSAYYSRHDHIHLQQLTYDGNITATKFIKTGGTAAEVLCANGDTLNGVVDIESDQTITGPKTFNNIFQIVPTGDNYNEGIRIAKANNESCKIFFGVDPNEHSGYIEGQWTVGIMLGQGPTAQQFSICYSPDQATANKGLRISTDGNILTFNGNEFVDVGSDQTINDCNPQSTTGAITDQWTTEYDDGLKISRTVQNKGGSSIFLGCRRDSNIGTIANQWQVFTPPSSYTINPLGLNISLSADSGGTA
ncbi:MAG: hypothetical protein EZS28_001825 [Streblomastix strix]|uniref:Uncharacterized protein n=1 Tax=Streblomastix strix TaxID=222440 RepID=A0A5J4X5X7_9EUKA|nr:MAG: hypothetical protein EZS28_001825 [Streblomastix strix]